MKTFRDLNITDESTQFTGSKIGIDYVLNQRITVLDFAIKDSKYKEKGNGKCLHLQIEYNGEKRVLFSGSVKLMRTLEMIDRDSLPFTTTIVKDFYGLKFT